MPADVSITTELRGLGAIDQQLRGVQQKFQRFGQQLRRIGTVMSVAVSAPIAGLGATTLRTASNFEAAMNRIQAVAQPTADAMAALAEEAKRLGAETKFSATEAAGAIETLAKNGLETSQILEGALDATLKLAAATGSDLSRAADIATDAMLQFGLQASELGVVTDTLTGIVNKSKFGIEDVGLALAQAGGTAGSVGVDFDELAAALAGTASSFSRGADAGTSFKVFLQRLAPDADKQVKLMNKLGLEFFDAAGNMRGMADIAGSLQDAFKDLSEQQRIQAASTLFGTDAMRTALALAELGRDGFSELTESVSAQGQAAEASAARMKGFEGAMLELKAAVEALQLAVADSGILEFAADLAKRLAELIRGLSETDPELLKLAATLAAVAAAIGPAVAGLGFLVTGIAALLSPIGLVVAAVAGLAAGWVAFGDDIKAFLSGAWQALQDAFVAAQDWIGAVATWFVDMRDAAVEAVQDLVEGVRDWIGGRLAAVFDGLKGKIDEVTGWFAGMYESVVGGSIVPDMVREIGSWFGRLGDVMVEPAEEATGRLSGSFRGLSRDVANFVGDMVRSGEASLEGFADFVDKTVSRVLDRLVEMAVVEPLARGLGSLFGNLAGSFGGNLPVVNAPAGPTPTVTPAAQGMAFGSGGVVHGPTVFRFAHGTGLMGEEGPEAIMPLQRTPSGDLGVRAAGGGAGPVNLELEVAVNIHHDGQPMQVADQRQAVSADGQVAVDIVLEQAVGRMIGQGRADQPMRQRFGIRPKVS